jgi:hypothetical protein
MAFGAGLGLLGGGALAGLGDLFGFGGDTNPADAAMPYLNQIAPMLQQYMSPYISQGQTAYGQMEGPLSQMTSNPTGFINNIMNQYQPSQQFQTQNQAALNSAANTAAAGGMRGSVQDIDNSANITNTLMGQDMQNWLNNVLGVQGRGLSGEQGLYGQGLGAASGLSSDLANLMNEQGSLAFQGQEQNNMNNQNLLQSLMSMGGFLAGSGFL